MKKNLYAWMISDLGYQRKGGFVVNCYVVESVYEGWLFIKFILCVHAPLFICVGLVSLLQCCLTNNRLIV